MKKKKENLTKSGGNLDQPIVRRSIEVLPEEFLIMIANGKDLIHKDLAGTINEFGQVYYVNIKDGKRRRLLYCA